MSSDTLSLITFLSTILSTGIFLFGAFRAVQIGRSLVSPVYRNRAFWIAAVMAYTVVLTVLTFVPIYSSPEITIIGAILNALPFAVLIAFVFAFVDSTIMAAMEMDFFHRDTLGWKRIRKPAFIVLLLSIAWGFPASNLTGNDSVWVMAGNYQVVVVVFGLLTYSVAALVVSSRRTSDKTMKRFLKFLGAGLACFLLALATVDSTYAFLLLISDALTLATPYFLYRSVMSLSPLTRIEEETA